MAIPFTVEEDRSEKIEQLLRSLLQSLEEFVRQSQLNVQPPTPPINRSPPQAPPNLSRVQPGSNRRSSRSSVETPTVNLLPTLVSDLTILTAEAAALVRVNSCTTSQLTVIPVERPPRRRTTSESSCCEEPKFSITAIVNTTTTNQDWSQNDDLRSPSELKAPADGLLSKIVPDSLSGSLWTAMICFVGWHIFWAR